MRDVFKSVVEKNSTPNYISGYSNVREAYREKYGERAWVGKYVESLGLRTPGVKAKEDKPYLAARRSIERAEKGVNKSSHYTSDENANKAGEKLPPLSRTPKGSFTVTIKGKQDSGRRGGYRERTISVELSGSDAYSFVNDPNFRTVWDAGDYPDFGEDDGDGGSGSMYEMTVA